MLFKSLTPDLEHNIGKYLESDGAIMSDRSFASLFIWREKYGVTYAVEDDFLFLKAGTANGRRIYYMPLGLGKISLALEKLSADARENGEDFCVMLVTPDRLAQIEKELPGVFDAVLDRDGADYVYETAKLAELPGKKFHSKRNFIARFFEEYGNSVSFEELTPADAVTLYTFEEGWWAKHGKSDFFHEYAALRAAMDNFGALGLFGMKVIIDGNFCAYSIAVKQGSAADILFEKANPEYTGIYPVVNREFAARYLSGFRYINREEDMGDEGLRKAKLSYHPDFLTEKYTIIRKT